MNKPFQIFPFASVPARVATPVHASRAASGAVLDLFLFGPDERLGEASASPRWATGEISFSSCDAVALSARAHRAAREAYAGVFGGEASRPLSHWLDELRRRLAVLFGARNCEAVLAASVHEGEMLFAALARAASDSPIVHLAAPPERPEGAGQPAETFTLRDLYGLALPIEDIDAQAARQVAEAIAKGADVALHVTDCSDTGLSAPSRAAVAALEQDHPGRLTVLIDARQMRAARETIAADLDAGRAVLLSGSTFAGGASGAAALLLPSALIERIGPFDLPGALAFQSAALDWPPILRERRRGAFAALADPRLGLRWESALAELEALFAIASDMRVAIASAFLREAHRHLAAAPLLKATDFRHPGDGAPTILPILTFDERGRAIRAANLRRALADPAARPGRRAARGRPIHLGAPVAIGSRDALRLALGAPQVNDVAERLATGESFAEAFRPLADDLHETFVRWSELAQDGL